MTTHVLDGRITHQRYDGIDYDRQGVWLEVTICGRWYVRQDHPLESKIPIDAPRYRVTIEPVDCMSCFVDYNRSYAKQQRTMNTTNTTSTTTSGLSLTAGLFEAPPLIVPNGNGEAFKIEQVVERSPERTVKLVWWFLADDDRDPHNHPWAFDSEILAGGYTSVTYWLEGGKVRTEERVVRAGMTVHYPKHEYHVVKDVLPGTRTKMTCGQATPGNAWGYLDPTTGREYPATQDPTFMERMLRLNPWRRPRP